MPRQSKQQQSTRQVQPFAFSPAYFSTHEKGGFIRAKLLLRFLGELLNCGLVEAQEYGDMLTTLCASYVTTELRQVQQPCRDMMAHMVLAGVLRVGPTLSKARLNRLTGFCDEVRALLYIGRVLR